MAALQLVGIEELFTPACKHSLQAFKPARGMPRKLAGFHPHCALPLSGPQAQLACVRTGVPQAARAADSHPHNRSHPAPSN